MEQNGLQLRLILVSSRKGNFFTNRKDLLTNRFTGHGKFPKANAGNCVDSNFLKDGMKNIIKQVVRNNFF